MSENKLHSLDDAWNRISISDARRVRHSQRMPEAGDPAPAEVNPLWLCEMEAASYPFPYRQQQWAVGPAGKPRSAARKSALIKRADDGPCTTQRRHGSGNVSIERDGRDEDGPRRRAASPSIEMNRIGSGISEGDELAESAGSRGKPGFALPSKAHVHGVNFVIQRFEIDAMPLERSTADRPCRTKW